MNSSARLIFGAGWTPCSTASVWPACCSSARPVAANPPLALLMAEARGVPFVPRQRARSRTAQAAPGNWRARKFSSWMSLATVFPRRSRTSSCPCWKAARSPLSATTTENPSFSVTRQLLSPAARPAPAPSGPRRAFWKSPGAAPRPWTWSWKTRPLTSCAPWAGGDARVLLNLLEYTADLPEDKRVCDELRGCLPEVVMRPRPRRRQPLRTCLRAHQIHPRQRPGRRALLPRLSARRRRGSPFRLPPPHPPPPARTWGLADPQALPLAVACQQAVEFTGMPEGFIPLAETVVYLALAPKSNASYLAYHEAQRLIRRRRPQNPCPCTCATPPPACKKTGAMAKATNTPTASRRLGRTGLSPHRSRRRPILPPKRPRPGTPPHRLVATASAPPQGIAKRRNGNASGGRGRTF